jgi:hypothetical protein
MAVAVVLAGRYGVHAGPLNALAPANIAGRNMETIAMS